MHDKENPTPLRKESSYCHGAFGCAHHKAALVAVDVADTCGNGSVMRSEGQRLAGFAKSEGDAVATVAGRGCGGGCHCSRNPSPTVEPNDAFRVQCLGSSFMLIVERWPARARASCRTRERPLPA